MRILFLVPSVPYPPHTGGQLRSWYLLRYLATKGDVTLVAIGNPAQYESCFPELKKYCNQIFLIDPKKFETAREQNRFSSMTKRIQKLIRLQPWLLDHFVDGEILKGIERARADDHDLIVIRFTVMAYHIFMNRRFRNILRKTVVDVDDVSTMMLERKLSGMEMNYKKLRTYWDLFCLRHYDRKLRGARACFAVSAKDKDYLVRNRINEHVFLIPNTYEVNGHHLDSVANGGAEILFCGMLSYPPNQDALFYFCDQIFPKIREVVPHAHLTVVGKHATQRINQLGERPGITVAGYVPSIESHYEKASLAVVPLLNGAGTRIKILEAMAYQRPVVSTSIGAEGLEVTDGKDILIADDPESFARNCVELIRNPKIRQQIAAHAYQLVKEKYDLHIFRKSMDDVFGYLAREKERETK